jgi:hypothetical protein
MADAACQKLAVSILTRWYHGLVASRPATMVRTFLDGVIVVIVKEVLLEVLNVEIAQQ